MSQINENHRIKANSKLGGEERCLQVINCNKRKKGQLCKPVHK